jgi:hypothetical protein
MYSNGIMKIEKNLHNKNIADKYLITGNESNILLDLKLEEKQEIIDMENNFGIVCHNKPFKYGNNKIKPNNIKDIKEPIRILIDECIFLLYTNHIKKLIILNTDKENMNYQTKSFKELIKDFEYDIIYKKYDINDLQNRYLPLPGKYNDAREIYQSNNKLNIEQKNLKEWYYEHLEIRQKINNDIQKKFNILFENENEYLFQIKHPLRFSIDNNLGTNIHIDSCRKKINNDELSNYLICENEDYKRIDKKYGYVETFQDKNIININYIIHDEDNENQISICNIEYDKIGKEDGYFFKPKLNYKNEVIIFNSSKYIHYKSFNHMNIYIRGDMRIINKKDYDFDKFKLYRGPRGNMNVCWCPENDIKLLKDDTVSYSVFS